MSLLQNTQGKFRSPAHVMAMQVHSNLPSQPPLISDHLSKIPKVFKCPREMSNFSKSLTMNWETTCDIPFKRYFLGCAINHTNRDGGGHILE